jgi:hypothetical protein
LKILQQPHAFALIRIQRDIDTAAMIKTQRPVERGLTSGAYRQQLGKLPLIGNADASKVPLPENPCPVKAFHDPTLRRQVGSSLVGVFFRANLGRKIFHELGSKVCQIKSLASELQILNDGSE